MTRRRAIGTLALAAILGLLTTLATAAALGAFVDVPAPMDYLPSVSRRFIADGVPWSLTETRRFGITSSSWSLITRRYFTSPDPGKPLDSALVWFRGSAPEEPAVLLRDFDKANNRELMVSRGGGVYDTRPLWGEFAIGRTPIIPQSRGPATPCGCDVGYGWPCHALWFQVRGWSASITSWGQDVNGGYVVRGSPTPKLMRFCRVVPYRPAWFGLAINTVMFAALWSVILIAPGALQRARRKRRGLCLRCGYDLNNTNPSQPCPECGKPCEFRRI